MEHVIELALCKMADVSESESWLCSLCAAGVVTGNAAANFASLISHNCPVIKIQKGTAGATRREDGLLDD